MHSSYGGIFLSVFWFGILSCGFAAPVETEQEESLVSDLPAEMVTTPANVPASREALLQLKNACEPACTPTVVALRQRPDWEKLRAFSDVFPPVSWERVARDLSAGMQVQAAMPLKEALDRVLFAMGPEGRRNFLELQKNIQSMETAGGPAPVAVETPVEEEAVSARAPAPDPTIDLAAKRLRLRELLEKHVKTAFKETLGWKGDALEFYLRPGVRVRIFSRNLGAELQGATPEHGPLVVANPSVEKSGAAFDVAVASNPWALLPNGNVVAVEPRVAGEVTVIWDGTNDYRLQAKLTQTEGTTAMAVPSVSLKGYLVSRFQIAPDALAMVALNDVVPAASKPSAAPLLPLIRLPASAPTPAVTAAPMKKP